MVLRIFKCAQCGHSMRFAGNRCGKCLAPKPTLQLPGVVVSLALIALALGAYVLVLLGL